MTDPQLLRAYAEDQSEAAFGELVRRHVDLTYSVALRIVRDAHLAEDVTQAVFVALAQNAGALAEHPVLSGWLHRAARNVASQTVRTEVRRRAREQEAATMNELSSEGSEPQWEEVAPHLDAVLAELGEADRDAVLLRYFEKKSAKEMGGMLGVSAEAAQKRVSRAVEQLRALFARRGVAVTAGGLALLISSNAVKAAPPGLAATVASAATMTGAASAAVAVPAGLGAAGASSAAVGTAALTLGSALMPKALVACAVVALAGVGFGVHGTLRSRALQGQVQAIQSQLKEKAEAARVAGPPKVPGVQGERPVFPSDGLAGTQGPAPTGGVAEAGNVGTGDARMAESTQRLMQQMTEEQRRFLQARGGMGSAGGSAGAGGTMGFGDGVAGGAGLSVRTVNGSTVIQYRGKEFGVGVTRGLVTTRAAMVQGREYAAAFDGDQTIWENVPGAAQRLR